MENTHLKRHNCLLNSKDHFGFKWPESGINMINLSPQRYHRLQLPWRPPVWWWQIKMSVLIDDTLMYMILPFHKKEKCCRRHFNRPSLIPGKTAVDNSSTCSSQGMYSWGLFFICTNDQNLLLFMVVDFISCAVLQAAGKILCTTLHDLCLFRLCPSSSDPFR